ncbi:MAG: alpha/beta hydrolase [Anaerolineae bacterium]
MFIEHGNARIFAAAFGSRTAPTILALGGWIGTWEDWIETLSLLSEDRRVIAFDHRGSGLTTAPIESITIDTLIDDVFAVMEAFDVERCSLAAMSMGVSIALGAALRHPGRITDLILVDSLDLRTPSPPLQVDDRFLQGLTHDYARTLEGFIQLCVPESGMEHIKEWGRHILRRASPEAAIALYQLSKTIRLEPMLPHVRQPALILHGDADPLASIDSAEWLARTLPKAKLQIISGAGHVPIMTRPDEVAAHIRTFLAPRNADSG